VQLKVRHLPNYRSTRERAKGNQMPSAVQMESEGGKVKIRSDPMVWRLINLFAYNKVNCLRSPVMAYSEKKKNPLPPLPHFQQTVNCQRVQITFDVCFYTTKIISERENIYNNMKNRG
jgi:hypothetical protein